VYLLSYNKPIITLLFSFIGFPFSPKGGQLPHTGGKKQSSGFQSQDLNLSFYMLHRPFTATQLYQTVWFILHSSPFPLSSQIKTVTVNPV